MMQIKLLMNFLIHLFQDIKTIQKHEVNFRCGGSYIDSPDWIKKKAAMNL